MRCLELQEWMTLRLDDRLSAAEEQSFQAHLSECPTCAQIWQQWQQVDRLFADPPMVSPPVDLAAKVWVRIEQRQRRGALAGSLALMALGLAVLAVLYVAPLAVDLLWGGLDAAPTPWLWATIASALLDLRATALALCSALAVGLRAVGGAQAVAAGLIYYLVAALALLAWLRVVVFRRVPAACGRAVSLGHVGKG